MKTALRVSLVLVLLGVGIAGPVVAIPSPGPGVTPPSPGPGGQPVSPPSSNPTPAPETPEPSGNESGGLIPNPLSGFTDWFSELSSALSNPWDSFQGLAEDLIQVIVSRPVATRGGEPELFLRPDGAIMGSMYDVAWGVMVPLGIIVAAMYAGLAEGVGRIIPPSVLPPYAASKARWQSLGRIPLTLLGWPIVVGWVVLCQFVAKALMPTGQQLFPDGAAIADQVIAGGIAGIVLWLSSGVLALLSLLVIALSLGGAILGPPLYPLLAALDPPDIPVLQRLMMVPKGGVIFSSIAAPVSTAAVLAVGYPLINALRTVSPSQIPIVSAWGVGIVAIVTFIVWFVALVMPIWLVVASHRMRPIAMIGAGLLGAAGGYTAGRGLSGAGTAASAGSGVASGAGAKVDPLKGSPFSRGGSGGFGGALADGGTSTAAGALGAGGSSAGSGSSGSGAMSGGGMMAASADGGGSTAIGGEGMGDSGGGSTHSTAGTTTSTSVEETINSWQDLSDEQQYEIGFQTESGWQEAIGQDAAHSKEWLQDGAFERINQAYDGTLKIRGTQDTSLYDPNQVSNQ